MEELGSKMLPRSSLQEGVLTGGWMKARKAELQKMSPDACRLRKSPITQEEVCN